MVERTDSLAGLSQYFYFRLIHSIFILNTFCVLIHIVNLGNFSLYKMSVHKRSEAVRGQLDVYIALTQVPNYVFSVLLNNLFK